MDRQAKLAKLKAAQAKTAIAKVKAAPASDSVSDNAVLAEAMQAIVADFKSTISRGVQINDLAVLVEHLEGFKELKNSVEGLKSAIKDFPKLPEEVKIASVNEFLDAIKSISVVAPDVILPEQKEINIPDYSGAIKQMGDAVMQLSSSVEATKPSPPGQRAIDFVPYRRVVKKGNTYVFDDQPTPQPSGSAASTPTRKDSNGDTYVPVANADGTAIGSAGSGGLTDAQLRASPVPVSMSSDTEIGAVELKNGTDDTRATVTPANALKVDGSAVTQPISGTVTATPTGTQTVAGNLTHNNAAPAATNVGALAGLANAVSPTFVEGDQVLLSTNLKGAARTVIMDSAGNDRGVTVSANNRIGVDAVQSGTWTVQPGNTANTTAWKVDGSAVTQPISAASLPLPSGASTSANQTAEQTLTGAVTETAPATDTASSGLNGRLQRIAQRITSLIALFPSSIGQKTKAGSLSVTFPSDVDTVPVSGTVTVTPSGTQDVNQKNVNGVTINVGTGAASTGTQRVAVASDSSITANAGTNLNTSALALSATQTDKSQFTKLTDGTDTALITAAGEQNVIATAQPGVDIGDVTINNATGASAVNIQDGGNSITVDGTVTASIAAGATTIAKAEDSASADADVGVPALAVRKATPINTSGSDGDYEFLQMSAGRLWVDASGKTLTVDGSGVTQPVSAASLPLPAGAATETTLATRLSESDFDTKTGSLTETAPATDTASSGLNGRLQRIAQRLTSLIAQIPATLGQKTSANSLAVTIASDQSAVPVSGTVTITPSGTQNENLAQVNAVTVLTGSGATGTGSQRVTVAVDSATVAGSASLPTGTNSIGKISDITTSVVPGTAATNLGKAVDSAAGATDTGVTNLIIRDDVLTTVTPVDGDYMPQRGDQYGNTYSIEGAVEVATQFNAVENDVDILVKASAGHLLSVTAANYNASKRYLQIHNKATAPSAADVPVWSFPIPAGTASSPGYLSFGNEDWGRGGYPLTTGIAVGVSTTALTFTAATTTDTVVSGSFT